MSKLTLSDIHDAVDKRYGDFTIEIPAGTKANPEATEEVAFRYYLRAPKEARTKLAKAYQEMSQAPGSAPTEDGPTLVDVFKEAFKALAVKPQHFTKLEKQLGDDLVLWTYVTNSYYENYAPKEGEDEEQLGEA
jgi:hypothetical protein